MTAPRVFVSYSYEDVRHQVWVRELAASLRSRGVDVALDQWDLQPGQEMTLFMESQVRDSDAVILVCTPTYAQKSNLPLGGVGYERSLITADMLQAQSGKAKFIPILRKGDFQDGLPTYLGSRRAVDFRETRDQTEALDELIRAIFDVPAPSKPAIGPNPFAADPREGAASGTIAVDGEVRAWESKARLRFEELRNKRVDKKKGDPFSTGYWQVSFALRGRLRELNLGEFWKLLRKSETGRTGWDIGWTPTREGIAPYPYRGGVEVWLAEEGGKEPGHSDFWRAEPIGTFSLFRGYTEDEAGFSGRYPLVQFDYGLMLWRVAECLLYLEAFAKNLAVGAAGANVRFEWTGLENRRLGLHRGVTFPAGLLPRCRQPSIDASYQILDAAAIKTTLISAVHRITEPLFEAFDFFSVTEPKVQEQIRELFDPGREIKG
jgi:hypothetical protein